MVSSNAIDKRFEPETKMNSEETKVCLICFDEIEKQLIVPGGESDKILKVCLTYLHDAIISMTLRSVQLKNKSRLPFCRNCFDFALDLTKLSEQLAKLEKKVLDTAVTFSLSVFHRKSQVDNSKNDQSHNTKASDGQTARKKIIEVDVTELPTHRFSSRRLQDGSKIKKIEKDHIDDSNNLGHKEHEEECTLDIDIVKHERYDETDETLNLSSLALLNQVDISLEEDGNDNDSFHSPIHSMSEDEFHPNNESNTPKEAKNCQETKPKAAQYSLSDIKKSVRMPQIRIRRLQFESARRKIVDSKKIYENKLGSDEECGIQPEVSNFEDEMKNDTKSSTTVGNKPTVNKMEIFQEGNKSHNCEYCNEVFETKGQLENHLKNMHSHELRVKCSICDKILGNERNLKEHRIRVHVGEKNYKCSICERAFTTVSTRNRHLQVHATEKKFVCSKCPKSFKLQSYLRIHLRTHDPITTLYQCSHCGKTFAEKSFMKVHEKIHAEKPHKCGFCDRRFTMGYQRRRHERVHTGERPYKCTYCSKTFSSTAGKVEHLRIHTGERPYNCPFCDKSFRQSTALAKHQRIHTGERPYGCSSCEKTFISSTALKRHTLSHTGSKPYECSICEKAFMTSSEFNRHVRRHTNKSFECEHCNVTFTTKKEMLTHQASEHNIVTIVKEETEVEYEAEDDDDKK